MTAVATQPTGGLIVRIWLPPGFDLEGNGTASGLLKARLEEFASENPEVRLEVRVKALDGTGGLLESLVAANAAAPLALPDLVLLPRPLLESAALKGLLYPYDGLTNMMDDQSWFEYARQLAQLKTSTYGIPFAGDALVMTHRPSLLETTPHSLEASLSLGEVLLYPATDPQALFTLCMYLAAGGSMQDAQGRPWMDEATLLNILEYDQRASLAGVMPYWLTQYSNDAQVWETYLGGEYPMAVTWASAYLNHQRSSPEDLAIAPLPTPDGVPFTLATGWSWALAGQNPERRTLSVRLAEYLVEKEFLAEWTYAAGYLPPRADALQNWQEAEARQVIEQISYSAWLMPSADVVSSLGPALEQAVVDVLKAQSDPQTATQSAINQINQP
jgi:ABC-type glycerol-3-phosphate transport system substrate-binding protein